MGAPCISGLLRAESVAKNLCMLDFGYSQARSLSVSRNFAVAIGDRQIDGG